MLATIVHQSVQLVKFIRLLKLDLKLKRAPLQHLTNVADALVVASERRKKTLAALNRQHVEPPTDEFALADSFRQSPWHAEDVRRRLLLFLVKYAIDLARQLNLDKIIWLSFDDSLCEKDTATEALEAVDWHHDHNARGKRQASYWSLANFVAHLFHTIYRSMSKRYVPYLVDVLAIESGILRLQA